MTQLVEWTTACLDWERRIVARESLIVSQPLFPEEADAAWDICGGFQIADIGGATVEEASRPWIKELVRAIFGAYDAEQNRRHINEFFLMVSKKNAKSTIAADIMLGALMLNGRQSAELLILSPTKEIADNSYKPIADMIKADEDLSALLKVQDYFRLITHLETGATLKVVAADSDTVSGKKASYVFVDELHEFGKQPKASNMLLEATGGLASRPEGFVIYATTQSAEPPAGVFKAKLDYARKVRDGKVVDRKFLPLIYEFPKAMLESGEYRDLNNAYITNPNWGASVDIERITQLHAQALEQGEKEFKEFLAKHLNVEIGLNLRSDRWAGADFWEKAAIPVFTLDELISRCEVATVGIDGGGLDDLLGLSVTGRERGSGRLLAWFHAWAHEIALERRKEIAPALLDFVKQGDLTIVKVPGDDVIEVADFVCQVNDAGLLPEKVGIGVDAAGIIDIVTELVSEERGITMEQIISIRQGYSLNGAIKTTERGVAARTLVHAGRPMMNWCVSNARIEDKGNAILVTKAASGKAKIDPLMALFNAVSLMALNPAGKGNSVYETRGIRMI
ncbi:terminase large subunit [Duganella sp. Leaf126]|uniref:terminase large subunit n=1 Tax=Duganella sp. Leaf126 TaxID=1736266 RepID=UPI000A6150C5|nr:terminase large subunit [Duganella sp. Leaf126]